MSDLISKSEAIEALDQHSYENGSDYAKTVELLNDLPALDAVQVVRCKDCEFRGDSFRCPLVIRVRDTIGFRGVDNAMDDDFCSRGKRADAKEG